MNRLTRDEFAQRFWSRVATCSENECWAWTGFTLVPNKRWKEGVYGQFYLPHSVTGKPSRSHRAHRIAYILTFGPIPEGMCVDHVCFNPLCCNPGHLQLLTLSENSKRRVPGGREVSLQRLRNTWARRKAETKTA